MGNKRYSAELREEVLKKIRSGRTVSAVAKEHGINEQSIRNWLQRETEGQGSEILELSRLRRQNEALMKVIGQLVYESEMNKKNLRRDRGN